MTVSTMTASATFDQRKEDTAKKWIEQGLQSAHGNVMLAYSGGKDGLCAAILAKPFGIHIGVCDTSFYFSQQLVDVQNTADDLGFHIDFRNTMDMDFFLTHPEYLFPQDSKLRNNFFQLRQRKTMEDYAHQFGFLGIITGRKRQGNSVKAEIYMQGKKPLVMIHPMADWTDADVWAYLQKCGVPRPWIYSTEHFGSSEGNSPWNIYRGHPTLGECWNVIGSIEPAIWNRACAMGLRGTI